MNRNKEPTPAKTRYKRPLDLVILVTGHLVLLPLLFVLWLVIPLAIWLGDRGPIIYRQSRFGKDGREFTLLKFRTMVPGADSKGLWTAEGDTRVTKVGGGLRRTGLDELPQAINILRGDMGFVGPRGLPTEMHNEAVKIEPKFAERLQVTPGLMGLAQLYLPRHCAPRHRLKYDLMYIKSASLWLDIRLLAWAAWYLVTGRWGRGRLSASAEHEDRTEVDM